MPVIHDMQRSQLTKPLADGDEQPLETSTVGIQVVSVPEGVLHLSAEHVAAAEEMPLLLAVSLQRPLLT